MPAQVLNPIKSILDLGVGILDIDASLAAATGLELQFFNDGNTIMFISNGSASPVTATLVSAPDTFGRGGTGDTQNDEAIIIPAGKMGMFPFMAPSAFNKGGLVNVTLSSFATIKVGIYRLVKAR